MYKIINISIIFQLLLSQSFYSQIIEERNIKSVGINTLKSNNEIPLISLPKFDIQTLIEEDEANKRNPNIPMRFAKIIDVNIDLKKDGLLESVSENDKIWRLRIKSAGAYSINIFFGAFDIPAGSELFVYNKDKTHIIGALTEKNNNSSKIVPIHPVEGDEVIIEYFEPFNAEYSGTLIINKVGHDYIGILTRLVPQDGDFGESANCNVDINCTAAANWQDEKQSVCKILILGSTCSGSLINNVDSDGTPYVLTAHHCIGSTYEANNSIFVFNYESPTCGGSDGSVNQSITNSTYRASSGFPHTDFSLVELSSMPPANYNPYWNGWYKPSTTPDEPVVMIHHPQGDVKKFNRDDQAPTESFDYFWRVNDWTVGTNEGGSSGAPLYNNDHRVVGQHYAKAPGSIPCEQDTAYIGIIGSSFNYGPTSSMRLRDWLDPSNGTNELPGLRFVSNRTFNGVTTTVSGDIIRLEDIIIFNNSDVSFDYEDDFIIDGPFTIGIGSTLSVL
jgi:hypothetical protein